MINKTYPITEKLLKKGLKISLNLLDLLKKEEVNLNQSADPAFISILTGDKKEIVSQLEQFSKQLSQVLATEKLQMTAIDIAAYFKIAETVNFNTEKETSQWQQILSISKQCRFLNEKNGASINLLAQHTHRSLRILKGKPQQSTTYGPDGSTDTGQFSRTLVSV